MRLSATGLDKVCHEGMRSEFFKASVLVVVLSTNDLLPRY
jgi:hypothetical protein